MKYYYIPTDLDFEKLKGLDELIEQTGEGRKTVISSLKYLVSLILKGPIFSKPNEFTKGWVHLEAKKLKDALGSEYITYLNYLEGQGIIQINHSYLEGDHTKSYRLVYRFSGVTIEPITRRRILTHVAKETLDAPEYLTRWFDPNKLEIDKFKALDIIEKSYPMVPSGKHGVYDISKKQFEILRKRLANQIAVQELSKGYLRIHRDSNIFRVHSNLTNISREVKGTIRYDGKPLVGLDIKSSQPFFMVSLLFNPTFYRHRTVDTSSPGLASTTAFLSIALVATLLVNTNWLFLIPLLLFSLLLIPKESYCETLNLLNTLCSYSEYKSGLRLAEAGIEIPVAGKEGPGRPLPPYMFPKNFEKRETYRESRRHLDKLRLASSISGQVEGLLYAEDIQKFRDLVLKEDVYEYACRELRKREVDVRDRDQAKTKFFGMIYDKSEIHYPDDFREAFKQVFPNVYKILDLYKQEAPNFMWFNEKKPHASLTTILQFLESIVVIDHVCRRIAEEHPDIPIFTIHDNVLTTKGNEHLVKKIMEETIEELTCHKPDVKEEKY